MTRIIDPSDDVDRARLDVWAADSQRNLQFPPDLELRYLDYTLPARARNTRIAGWFGVLAYNFLLSFNFLNGVIVRDSATSVLMVTHVCVTLPCLTFMYFTRRVRSPKALDVWLFCAYALVTTAALYTNEHIVGEAAVYDAFTMVLIPVTCNIALPISFGFAALGSTFSVVALTLTSLFHSGFSADARMAMILVYVVGAGVTLVASHRHEAASRSDFLGYLRETLRNADVQRANALLAAVSRTDFLTGLPNRRDFDERFLTALARCERDGLPLTVLIADIDHFKKLNDHHGHIEGDACLKRVARAIAAGVEGSGGVAARFGGEEFAVVLPGSSLREATVIAERIQTSVRALRILNLGLGERRYVSISLGAASWSARYPEAPSDLLARADSALYRAKRGGRDRTEVDLRADAA